jgi:CRISPR-associated protein Cmr3
MTTRTLLIEPHDPVIFRDGRPFTDGLPAATLPFPLPITTAGAIRTRSGANLDFADAAVIESLRRICQTGPFAAILNDGKWEPLFPAPADAVPYGSEKQVEYVSLRPTAYAAPGGCDLPEGLRPLFGARPDKALDEAPRFWRSSFLLRWLTNKAATVTASYREVGFEALPEQRRVHVAIDPTSLTADKHMLFTTGSLEFTWRKEKPNGSEPVGDRLNALPVALISRIECPEGSRWPAVAPLGGERRLALWRELPAAEVAWPAPPALKGEIVRAILVTPGAFDLGWKPGWCGGLCPPGMPDLKLELVAAASPRFQPVSGWDLQARGPKATRFLVPAGSVFFFRVIGGDPAKLWMRSICDREQDRRDGFGIVLLGDC